MKTSAGLLVHRATSDGPQVLLAHPGGPLWAKRDLGAWSIPKGLVEPGEDLLAAARREFREETGLAVEGPFRPLAPVRQKGGKVVHAWAVEADPDLSAFAPGTFEMVWPPRSGRLQSFPEVDRVCWFGVEAALGHILPAQASFVSEALGLDPGG